MEKPIWKAPAWRTGEPFSSASSTARSLSCSVSLSAIASSTAARWAGGGRRRQAPAAVGVRGLGRGDRPVGLLEAALGHAGHQLLRGRTADLEPVVGVNPVAVDE